MSWNSIVTADILKPVLGAPAPNPTPDDDQSGGSSLPGVNTLTPGAPTPLPKVDQPLPKARVQRLFGSLLRGKYNVKDDKHYLALIRITNKLVNGASADGISLTTAYKILKNPFIKDALRLSYLAYFKRVGLKPPPLAKPLTKPTALEDALFAASFNKLLPPKIAQGFRDGTYHLSVKFISEKGKIVGFRLLLHHKGPEDIVAEYRDGKITPMPKSPIAKGAVMWLQRLLRMNNQLTRSDYKSGEFCKDTLNAIYRYMANKNLISTFNLKEARFILDEMVKEAVKGYQIFKGITGTDLVDKVNRFEKAREALNKLLSAIQFLSRYRDISLNDPNLTTEEKEFIKDCRKKIKALRTQAKEIMKYIFDPKNKQRMHSLDSSRIKTLIAEYKKAKEKHDRYLSAGFNKRSGRRFSDGKYFKKLYRKALKKKNKVYKKLTDALFEIASRLRSYQQFARYDKQLYATVTNLYEDTMLKLIDKGELDDFPEVRQNIQQRIQHLDQTILTQIESVADLGPDPRIRNKRALQFINANFANHPARSVIFSIVLNHLRSGKKLSSLKRALTILKALASEKPGSLKYLAGHWIANNKRISILGKKKGSRTPYYGHIQDLDYVNLGGGRRFLHLGQKTKNEVYNLAYMFHLFMRSYNKWATTKGEKVVTIKGMIATTQEVIKMTKGNIRAMEGHISTDMFANLRGHVKRRVMRALKKAGFLDKNNKLTLKFKLNIPFARFDRALGSIRGVTTAHKQQIHTALVHAKSLQIKGKSATVEMIQTFNKLLRLPENVEAAKKQMAEELFAAIAKRKMAVKVKGKPFRRLMGGSELVFGPKVFHALIRDALKASAVRGAATYASLKQWSPELLGPKAKPGDLFIVTSLGAYKIPKSIAAKLGKTDILPINNKAGVRIERDPITFMTNDPMGNIQASLVGKYPIDDPIPILTGRGIPNRVGPRTLKSAAERYGESDKFVLQSGLNLLLSMHTKALKTLAYVIGQNSPDSPTPVLLRKIANSNGNPVYLTPQEKTDLEAFLVSFKKNRAKYTYLTNYNNIYAAYRIIKRAMGKLYRKGGLSKAQQATLIKMSGYLSIDPSNPDFLYDGSLTRRKVFLTDLIRRLKKAAKAKGISFNVSEFKKTYWATLDILQRIHGDLQLIGVKKEIAERPFKFHSIDTSSIGGFIGSIFKNIKSIGGRYLHKGKHAALNAMNAAGQESYATQGASRQIIATLNIILLQGTHRDPLPKLKTLNERLVKIEARIKTDIIKTLDSKAAVDKCKALYKAFVPLSLELGQKLRTLKNSDPLRKQILAFSIIMGKLKDIKDDKSFLTKSGELFQLVQTSLMQINLTLKGKIENKEFFVKIQNALNRASQALKSNIPIVNEVRKCVVFHKVLKPSVESMRKLMKSKELPENDPRRKYILAFLAIASQLKQLSQRPSGLLTSADGLLQKIQMNMAQIKREFDAETKQKRKTTFGLLHTQLQLISGSLQKLIQVRDKVMPVFVERTQVKTDVQDIVYSIFDPRITLLKLKRLKAKFPGLMKKGYIASGLDYLSRLLSAQANDVVGSGGVSTGQTIGQIINQAINHLEKPENKGKAVYLDDLLGHVGEKDRVIYNLRCALSQLYNEKMIQNQHLNLPKALAGFLPHGSSFLWIALPSLATHALDYGGGTAINFDYADMVAWSNNSGLRLLYSGIQFLSMNTMGENYKYNLAPEMYTLLHGLTQGETILPKRLARSGQSLKLNKLNRKAIEAFLDYVIQEIFPKIRKSKYLRGRIKYLIKAKIKGKDLYIDLTTYVDKGKIKAKKFKRDFLHGLPSGDFKVFNLTHASSKTKRISKLIASILTLSGEIQAEGSGENPKYFHKRSYDPIYTLYRRGIKYNKPGATNLNPPEYIQSIQYGPDPKAGKIKDGIKFREFPVLKQLAYIIEKIPWIGKYLANIKVPHALYIDAPNYMHKYALPFIAGLGRDAINNPLSFVGEVGLETAGFIAHFVKLLGPSIKMGYTATVGALGDFARGLLSGDTELMIESARNFVDGMAHTTFGFLTFEMAPYVFLGDVINEIRAGRHKKALAKLIGIIVMMRAQFRVTIDVLKYLWKKGHVAFVRVPIRKDGTLRLGWKLLIKNPKAAAALYDKKIRLDTDIKALSNRTLAGKVGIKLLNITMNPFYYLGLAQRSFVARSGHLTMQAREGHVQLVEIEPVKGAKTGVKGTKVDSRWASFGEWVAGKTTRRPYNPRFGLRAVLSLGGDNSRVLELFTKKGMSTKLDAKTAKTCRLIFGYPTQSLTFNGQTIAAADLPKIIQDALIKSAGGDAAALDKTVKTPTGKTVTLRDLINFDRARGTVHMVWEQPNRYYNITFTKNLKTPHLLHKGADGKRIKSRTQTEIGQLSIYGEVYADLIEARANGHSRKFRRILKRYVSTSGGKLEGTNIKQIWHEMTAIGNSYLQVRGTLPELQRTPDVVGKNHTKNPAFRILEKLVEGKWHNKSWKVLATTTDPKTGRISPVLDESGKPYKVTGKQILEILHRAGPKPNPKPVVNEVIDRFMYQDYFSQNVNGWDLQHMAKIGSKRFVKGRLFYKKYSLGLMEKLARRYASRYGQLKYKSAGKIAKQLKGSALVVMYQKYLEDLSGGRHKPSKRQARKMLARMLYGRYESLIVKDFHKALIGAAETLHQREVITDKELAKIKDGTASRRLLRKVLKGKYKRGSMVYRPFKDHYKIALTQTNPSYVPPSRSGGKGKWSGNTIAKLWDNYFMEHNRLAGRTLNDPTARMPSFDIYNYEKAVENYSRRFFTRARRAGSKIRVDFAKLVHSANTHTWKVVDPKTGKGLGTMTFELGKDGNPRPRIKLRRATALNLSPSEKGNYAKLQEVLHLQHVLDIARQLGIPERKLAEFKSFKEVVDFIKRKTMQLGEDLARDPSKALKTINEMIADYKAGKLKGKENAAKRKTVRKFIRQMNRLANRTRNKALGMTAKGFVLGFMSIAGTELFLDWMGVKNYWVHLGMAMSGAHGLTIVADKLVSREVGANLRSAGRSLSAFKGAMINPDSIADDMVRLAARPRLSYIRAGWNKIDWIGGLGKLASGLLQGAAIDKFYVMFITGVGGKDAEKSFLVTNNWARMGAVMGIHTTVAASYSYGVGALSLSAEAGSVWAARGATALRIGGRILGPIAIAIGIMNIGDSLFFSPDNELHGIVRNAVYKEEMRRVKKKSTRKWVCGKVQHFLIPGRAENAALANAHEAGQTVTDRLLANSRKAREGLRQMLHQKLLLHYYARYDGSAATSADFFTNPSIGANGKHLSTDPKVLQYVLGYLIKGNAKGLSAELVKGLREGFANLHFLKPTAAGGFNNGLDGANNFDIQTMFNSNGTLKKSDGPTDHSTLKALFLDWILGISHLKGHQGPASVKKRNEEVLQMRMKTRISHLSMVQTNIFKLIARVVNTKGNIPANLKGKDIVLYKRIKAMLAQANPQAPYKPSPAQVKYILVALFKSVAKVNLADIKMGFIAKGGLVNGQHPQFVAIIKNFEITGFAKMEPAKRSATLETMLRMAYWSDPTKEQIPELKQIRQTLAWLGYKLDQATIDKLAKLKAEYVALDPKILGEGDEDKRLKLMQRQVDIDGKESIAIFRKWVVKNGVSKVLKQAIEKLEKAEEATRGMTKALRKARSLEHSVSK